ncbi:MAG: right-handed parallel beta-helix repeat-containing protein [Candidatus Sumerlaeota bacterium]|nr:right-handed parallel beta-helix repeat-containing protein [Candidatus Sumerlaeota bacterium]
MKTSHIRSASILLACVLTPLYGVLILALLPPPSICAATISPKAFDSAAITVAIKQAAPGDTIHLPAGTYEITEPIPLKSNLKFIGAGQDKTCIVYSKSATKPISMLRIEGCQDVEVAHLTLDGQGGKMIREGIFSGNSRRLFIHHVTVRNLAKGDSNFVHGIMFSGRNPTMERGVTDSVISDCRFEKIGLGAEYGGGIRVAWGSVRNRIERNVVRDTGRGGIFGDHSAELIIRNNQVSGSGGEGLGIEIWGGCPRSLIEDNVIDHWLSVDAGGQSAVRRNVIGAEDGTLKFIGIEIIARDTVVTDNVVKRGALIGLSVSNKPVKNNVYWAYNTVSGCVQWGTQFQGESGGIAHHYFYKCVFENTVSTDTRARYPKDAGHGFRFNGECRGMALEECVFRNNAGMGVQFTGKDIDAISFVRCAFTNNKGRVMNQPPNAMALEFDDCRMEGNQNNQLPAAKPFSDPPPKADFQSPEIIRVGEPTAFRCASTPTTSIVERLWDFGHGLPDVTAEPKHVYEQPGKYRVALIVWDNANRGARIEKTIEALPAANK